MEELRSMLQDYPKENVQVAFEHEGHKWPENSIEG